MSSTAVRRHPLFLGSIALLVVLAGCGAPTGGPSPATEQSPGPATPETPVDTPASPTQTDVSTPAEGDLPPGVAPDGSIQSASSLMEANEETLRTTEFNLTFTGYQATDDENLSFRIHLLQGSSQRYITVHQGNDTARKWEQDRASAILRFGASQWVFENSPTDLEGSPSLEFDQYYHPKFIAEYLEMGDFRLTGRTSDTSREVFRLEADRVDPEYDDSAPSDLSITVLVTPDGLITLFAVESASPDQQVKYTHRVTAPDDSVTIPRWLSRDVSRFDGVPEPNSGYLALQHQGGKELSTANLSIFSNDDNYARYNMTAGTVAEDHGVGPDDTIYLIVHKIDENDNTSYRVRTAINERPSPPDKGEPVDPQEIAVALETSDQRLFITPP